MKKLLLIVVSVLLVGALTAQNDRATFGLKGNVTKLIQSEDYENRINLIGSEWETYNLVFTESGKLYNVEGQTGKISPDDASFEIFYHDLAGYSEYSLKRDAKNRISILYHIAGDAEELAKIQYDEKGRVASIKLSYDTDYGVQDNGTNLKYYYDESDNVVKVIYYDGYEKKTHTITYKNLEFDAAGNWTKRVANCPTMGINNRVETRVLSY